MNDVKNSIKKLNRKCAGHKKLELTKGIIEWNPRVNLDWQERRLVAERLGIEKSGKFKKSPMLKSRTNVPIPRCVIKKDSTYIIS